MPSAAEKKKMVFESVVVDVLNRFLGDYVVNLDESQLSLGIWKGNGVAAPGSRETAARFLMASSVLGQSGAATCSCPPRPSSYVKRGGGSRAGGARAVRLGEARAEASRPGGALDLGAGDPWPPLGKGAIPGSFLLGCREGSGEPMASRTPTCNAREGQARSAKTPFVPSLPYFTVLSRRVPATELGLGCCLAGTGK